jgi:photosystem II stability/assembly factor-like uncharacterized protein
VRGRTLVFLAVALFMETAATAAQIEGDDAAARLIATREWYGADVAGRARILEAARRERDRYAIGDRRFRARNALSAPTLNALERVSNSAFVSVGPTRADFAVNGDKYFEIDSGRARQILAHPTDPNILYLATSGGGVWKTYSAQGPTVLWEPLTDVLGTTAVGTLAMDPANPDLLFLGFGDPFDVQQPGLTRSLDGGGTWSDPVQLKATYTLGAQSFELTAGSVTDIKVDPRNSLVVLATTDAGLFRSIDGGAQWQHVPLPSQAPGYFYMWSLAYAGNDTWLATGQMGDVTQPPTPATGGTLGLWRSTDDGFNWVDAAGALPAGEDTARLGGRATLATAQSTLVEPASARIYLLVAKSDGRAQLDLLRSDDAGLSFQSLDVHGSRRPVNPTSDQSSLDVLADQAWYNQALLVDPANPDVVFIGGQLAMVRSSDAGRSWYVLSDWLPNNSENNRIDRPYIHADLHAFAVGADGAFYAGSDGGIAVSANALWAEARSVSFTSAHNEGLVTHLAYTVACAPETWPASAQSFVAGGLQDNGTRLRVGDTTTFNQVLGGDGIGVAVSAGAHFDATLQTDVPNILFASVPGFIYRSDNGGQSFLRFTRGLAALPFFVRIARITAAPTDAFLTISGSPAGVYKWHDLGVRPLDDRGWSNVSGTLHWQDSNRTTQGFVTLDGTPITLRNVATHRRDERIWAAVSNRYTYMTSDAGANWLVGLQPRPPPPGPPGGVWLLTSVEFDPQDPSGRSYYLTHVATTLIDAENKLYPYPPTFGHVLRTEDAGLSWQSLGAQDVAAGGLPKVGVGVIKVDPNDSNTLYVGTEIGLYRSTDRGATWSRFGAGTLPFVEVRDICIAPQSQRLTVATYGRGFWQIDTAGSASNAGVRGLGDTNFDSRIDGEDLIDLADGLGATQASPVYRWQADLIGATNKIDEQDRDALLAKFGGRP